MINRVTILGRLVETPEIRATPAGTFYARATIANEQIYKEKKHTNFVDILAWGGLAENLSKYCDKGRKILIDGRLEIKKNTKGETTYINTTIIAENIDFLEAPKTGQKFEEIEDAEVPF